MVRCIVLLAPLFLFCPEVSIFQGPWSAFRHNTHLPLPILPVTRPLSLVLGVGCGTPLVCFNLSLPPLPEPFVFVHPWPLVSLGCLVLSCGGAGVGADIYLASCTAGQRCSKETGQGQRGGAGVDAHLLGGRQCTSAGFWTARRSSMDSAMWTLLLQRTRHIEGAVLTGCISGVLGQPICLHLSLHQVSYAVSMGVAAARQGPLTRGLGLWVR